jgi:chromosome segregation ATPase
VTVETLTYVALAERLKISPEAARSFSKRLRLQRTRSNDGKTLVTVDLDEVRHKPMPARSSGGNPAITGVVATLKARIEALQAELAKLEAAAAGHRADFERERDRAELLVSEVLAATADMMEAKETAAKLEGELVALRSLLQLKPMTWWRWLRTVG